MSVIRPPRRLDLQPRRCRTMREYVLPVPPRDPREQAVQVRVDPVPPEGLMMSDDNDNKWVLLARIDYLQQCSRAAIDAGEQIIATLSGEKAELLAALKAVTERMDRAGGDNCGMPECPWCHHGPDYGSGDDSHACDCELVLARVAIAKAEGR